MDIINQIENDLNELANYKEQLEEKQKEEILSGIKQLITNDYVKEEPIKEPIEKEINSEDYNEDLLNDFVNGVKSIIKFFASIFSIDLFSEDKNYTKNYSNDDSYNSMIREGFLNEYECKKEFLLNRFKRHEAIGIGKYTRDSVRLNDDYEVIYRIWNDGWQERKINYNEALRKINIEAIKRVNEDYDEMLLENEERIKKELRRKEIFGE